MEDEDWEKPFKVYQMHPHRDRRHQNNSHVQIALQDIINHLFRADMGL